MSHWIKIWKQKAWELKIEVYTLYLAYKDPRVPLLARVFAACVVGYAFSPIDLIPDPIPIFGYLDDLVLIPLGVILARKMIPHAILNECREQAQAEMKREKPVNWAAAAIIIIIWILLATLAIRLFGKFIGEQIFFDEQTGSHVGKRRRQLAAGNISVSVHSLELQTQREYCILIVALLILQDFFQTRLFVLNQKEDVMTIKRMLQMMVVIAILFTSFASTGGAAAWSGCPGQVVVQWGDTMSSIAATCGTTVEAILAANPGIDWWVYAGQVLNIPTGYTYLPVVYYPTYGSTYVIKWGDTLGNIAASMGFNLSDLLAVNPQIWNPSLIYPGQVINLPGYISAPPPVVNYPPPPPPVNYPPVDYSQYSTLTISYKNGMIVRSGPGNEYRMINSALYKTEWKYSIYTRTFDTKGQLWVQVYFPQTSKGYTSGWMLVKDHLGNYFTTPQIDP